MKDMLWDVRDINTNWDLHKSETKRIINLLLGVCEGEFYPKFRRMYYSPPRVEETPMCVEVALGGSAGRRVLRAEKYDNYICHYSYTGLGLRLNAKDYGCIYLMNQIIFAFQEAGLILQGPERFVARDGEIFYNTGARLFGEEIELIPVTSRDQLFVIPSVSFPQLPDQHVASPITYQDAVALLIGGGS